MTGNLPEEPQVPDIPLGVPDQVGRHRDPKGFVPVFARFIVLASGRLPIVILRNQASDLPPLSNPRAVSKKKACPRAIRQAELVLE